MDDDGERRHRRQVVIVKKSVRRGHKMFLVDPGTFSQIMSHIYIYIYIIILLHKEVMKD